MKPKIKELAKTTLINPEGGRSHAFSASAGTSWIRAKHYLRPEATNVKGDHNIW